MSMMGICGTAKEVDVEAQELIRTNKESFKHMSQNIGRRANYLEELVKKKGCDLYLNAKDCIKHGIANKIGTPHLEVRLFAELHFLSDDAWTNTGHIMNVSGNDKHTGKRKRADSDDDSDSDG